MDAKKQLDDLAKRADFSWLEDLLSLVPDAIKLVDLEVIQLMRGAMAAGREGRWQTAASLWERVVARLENMQLQTTKLGAKSKLADAYKTLGKNRQALALYVEIIGITHNLAFPESLQDDTRMMDEASSLLAEPLIELLPGMTADLIVADAYCGLVSVGLKLPEFSLVQLYDVLDDGLRFLERKGHPEWGHKLRLKRADLLSEQGKKLEALDEARAALAMRQYDSDGPGFSLATHLCQVGDCLNAVERYEEAISYFEQVLDDPRATKLIRRRAYGGLVDSYLGLGNLELAEEIAREQLKLAQQMESPVALRASFSFLSLILSRQGNIREASHAAAQMWLISRKVRGASLEYRTQLRCGEVRLEQARKLLRLDAEEELPETLSQEVLVRDGKVAQRYALSAQRWLERARKPAVQLDARANVQTRQDKIDALRREISKILALAA